MREWGLFTGQSQRRNAWVLYLPGLRNGWEGVNMKPQNSMTCQDLIPGCTLRALTASCPSCGLFDVQMDRVTVPSLGARGSSLSSCPPLRPRPSHWKARGSASARNSSLWCRMEPCPNTRGWVPGSPGRNSCGLLRHGAPRADTGRKACGATV